MKRTTEITLSVIGVIMFIFLFVGSFAVFSNIQDNIETQKSVQEFLTDEKITDVSADQVMSFLSNGALYFVVISIISVILGIISIIILKKNNRAKMAGSILIVTAIVSTLLTVFLGILGGISYLIAGIVTFVRSKKTTLNQ